jgi:hypothetical protein
MAASFRQISALLSNHPAIGVELNSTVARFRSSHGDSKSTSLLTPLVTITFADTEAVATFLTLPKTRGQIGFTRHEFLASRMGRTLRIKAGDYRIAYEPDMHNCPGQRNVKAPFTEEFSCREASGRFAIRLGLQVLLSIGFAPTEKTITPDISYGFVGGAVRETA